MPDTQNCDRPSPEIRQVHDARARPSLTTGTLTHLVTHHTTDNADSLPLHVAVLKLGTRRSGNACERGWVTMVVVVVVVVGDASSVSTGAWESENARFEASDCQ